MNESQVFYDWCIVNGYVNNRRRISSTEQYFSTPEIWHRFETFKGTTNWGWYITSHLDKKFLKDNRYE